MTELRHEVPPWTLGWRLQRALSWADISVEQMARELEVSRSTVSGWLNDRHAPRAIYVREWARRCRVPINWLMEGDDGNSTRKHVGSHHEHRASGRTSATAGKREITEWSKKIPPDWNSQLHRAIPTDPRIRELEMIA